MQEITYQQAMEIDFGKKSIMEISALIADNQSLRLYVAENMRTFGGDFVKPLGECLMRADRGNRLKLCEAFIEYILEYQPKKWPKK